MCLLQTGRDVFSIPQLAAFSMIGIVIPRQLVYNVSIGRFGIIAASSMREDRVGGKQPITALEEMWEALAALLDDGCQNRAMRDRAGHTGSEDSDAAIRRFDEKPTPP